MFCVFICLECNPFEKSACAVYQDDSLFMELLSKAGFKIKKNNKPSEMG